MQVWLEFTDPESQHLKFQDDGWVYGGKATDDSDFYIRPSTREWSWDKVHPFKLPEAGDVRRYDDNIPTIEEFLQRDFSEHRPVRGRHHRTREELDEDLGKALEEATSSFLQQDDEREDQTERR